MSRRLPMCGEGWGWAALLLWLAAVTVVPAQAQMLAHPGWRGNGIATAIWWREAIFVRAEPGSKISELTRQLDMMVNSGADAVILPVLSQGGDLTQIDAGLGSTDDLDALLRAASARRMHVIVSLPYEQLRQAGDGGAGAVRFWLTRGLAGVDLGAVDAGDGGLRSLRSAVDQSAGQRVLMARGAASEGQPDSVMLRVVSPEPDGQGARVHTAQSAGPKAARHSGRSLSALEMTASPAEADVSGAQEVQAVPLLFSQGPLILSSAMLRGVTGEKPWLPQMLVLRRTNAALRRGMVSALTTDQPGISAWIARPASPSLAQPAVMVLSNASGSPATLHLQAQVSAMHVRGVFLRALLRNDGGMGSLNLDRITLPPGGVFVGEIRY